MYRDVTLLPQHLSSISYTFMHELRVEIFYFVNIEDYMPKHTPYLPEHITTMRQEGP